TADKPSSTSLKVEITTPTTTTFHTGKITSTGLYTIKPTTSPFHTENIASTSVYPIMIE
ncbi:hypothetical protein ACJMK2_012245, partial [Sinanodonta woodiana]